MGGGNVVELAGGMDEWNKVLAEAKASGKVVSPLPAKRHLPLVAPSDLAALWAPGHEFLVF